MRSKVVHDYLNVDEDILNDFRQAWKEAMNGETIPVDQLWED